MDEIKSQIEDIKKEIADIKNTIATHDHEGLDSVAISADNITPSIRALGSIQMSTDGRVYKIGVISNPSSILLFGNAVHYDSGIYGTGSIDTRCFINGYAILGKSFNFQPQTSSSVVTGGIPQYITQGSAYFGDGVSGVHTISDEFHLVEVEYPSGSFIVARADVTEFSVDSVSVKVSLSAGWGITATFIVT